MLAQSTLEPVDSRLRPLAALGAVRRLMKNPDDTAQVFVILKAMRGGAMGRAFRRFAASPTGARILAEGRDLVPVLEDHDRLGALPEGTLGRAYRNFMVRENLSVAGLAEAAEAAGDMAGSSALRLFRARMRAMHDLSHVMTGYGRDPLGELCLLAFSFAQTPNPGIGLIVLMGLLKSLRAGGWKVAAAVVEGWRHGHAAAWLAGQDWEALLDQPLDALRARLAIAPPRRYRAVATPAAKPAVPRRLPAGLVSLGRSLLINLLGPWLIYRLAAPHFAAASALPLLLSALVPAGDLAWQFVKQRMVDVVAIISLVQLCVSIAITLLAGDAQLALDGHALMPAALGLVFALSALAGMPLIQALARQSMAGDDPEKQARFDAVAVRPGARRTFLRLTLAWTAALMAEAVLLLLACNRMAADDYLLVSPLVSYGVLGLLIWASIAYGKRAAARAAV